MVAGLWPKLEAPDGSPGRPHHEHGDPTERSCLDTVCGASSACGSVDEGLNLTCNHCVGGEVFGEPVKYRPGGLGVAVVSLDHVLEGVNERRVGHLDASRRFEGIRLRLADGVDEPVEGEDAVDGEYLDEAAGSEAFASQFSV